MLTLLNALFGCSHKRTTFPITPSRSSRLSGGAPRGGTYVACLDCGKEFDYNWKEMRVSSSAAAPARAVPVSIVNN
jgi:hypothetical protein